VSSDGVRSAESRHPNQVLAVLILACVSFALAQTMVVPAVAGIAEEVGTSTVNASWVLTGFLLSASVATPIVGKLGDLYGKGRVLSLVLLIFSFAGVVNAFADSIGVLIVGRVAQGVAGGVFPLSYGVIRDTFPRNRVPSALGLVSAVFGIGGGIGLPLSGWILDHLQVSWIFWLNLLALPAAAAAYWVIPPSPPVPKSRIDWAGALLLSAALTLALLGVTQADGWGWGSPRTIGLIGLGLLVLALWMWVETGVAAPLIHMGVLRRPAVAATNLVGLLVGFAMFGSFLAIPQFA
jgi:MFS family permease